MASATLGTVPALAGNLDAFYLSGDAALQGGAITATARGGGATYYNPAGLAELPGLRLDVSVNAVAVRLGGHPDVDATVPGTKIERLTTLDLNIVGATEPGEPETLVFGTTLALSYAVGVGDVVRTEFGNDPSTPFSIREVPTSVVAHEFRLHLSSSLME
jgi:hypothetical protein